MKTVIIYETKYGFTKEIAELIQTEVKDTEIFSIDDIESINLKKYDRIFVCSNIVYGEVGSKTAELFKKRRAVLIGKDIKFFCSALDPIDFTKAVQDSMDPELFLHMKVYNVGGRVVWENLSFIEKFRLKRRLKISDDAEELDIEEIKKFINMK